MNELLRYFQDSTISELIIGLIVVAWLLRFIYEIIFNRDA